MKKLQLLLIGLFLSIGIYAQNNDPVVLTIEGEDIHASEFLYIYSKNNENPSFAKDSLDDYMQLFINYKLKVKEARTQKYDTIPRLINELAQYRKQLSLPYMINKEANEKLIEQAYDRTVNEVRASHLLIRLKENPSPADTNAAYVKTMQLRNRIINGEKFEDVAKGVGGSEDPSVKLNGGDLGYFTALQMVYPFEEAAFNTAVGNVSMPTRTRFGYHLIYVSDKRPSKGMIETAHILVLSDAKATDKDQEKAEKKINEIYALLEGGDKFEDLAAKFSDDKSSSNKGGVLAIFGSGAKQRMVPNFEEAAYAIEKDGDYSKPVKTMFGYHIIKRIHILPVPTYEKMYRELKLRVERDSRSETTKDLFIEDLKKEYVYRDDAKDMLPLIYNDLGDEIFRGQWKGLKNRGVLLNELFAFGDVAFSIGDFEKYIIAHQVKMRRVEKQQYVTRLMRTMVNEEIIKYEDSKLESKYPDFKSLMQEYRDGILVFEIMQDEIWKKASKDTVGIKNYFNTHRSDFTYPIRYDGSLYTCKDKAKAKEIVAYLEEGKLSTAEIVMKINEDSELNSEVKNQIFNSETTEAFKIRKPLKHIDKVTDKTDLKAIAKYKKKVSKAKAKHAKYKQKQFKNGINKPYKNGKVYYVFNVKETLPSRQREFNEAKGLVTAAYQNQLEKEWLSSLRNKYAIKIHEEALYNLDKN